MRILGSCSYPTSRDRSGSSCQNPLFPLASRTSFLTGISLLPILTGKVISVLTAQPIDLRSRALLVTMDEPPSPVCHMSARATARCLSGCVALVARRFGIPVMQASCSELARQWELNMSLLPTDETGYCHEAIQFLAAAAIGLRTLAGRDNLLAALSFWATERDVAVWSQIAE